MSCSEHPQQILLAGLSYLPSLHRELNKAQAGARRPGERDERTFSAWRCLPTCRRRAKALSACSQ